MLQEWLQKPALLVIDVQNDFFNLNQVCSDSLKSAIECIKAAIDIFRKKNLPIVVVQRALMSMLFHTEFLVLLQEFNELSNSSLACLLSFRAFNPGYSISFVAWS